VGIAIRGEGEIGGSGGRVIRAGVAPLPHVELSVNQPPAQICLLGNFRLLKFGRAVPTTRRAKIVTLLSNLGLHWEHGMRRDALLLTLWPSGDRLLARQSLNSLVHSLRRMFADAISGDGPVRYTDGAYRLNLEAGVAIDVAQFEHLVTAADRYRVAGEPAAAQRLYAAAVELYRGDLCMDTDPQDVIERERLRSTYLAALGNLAEHHYTRGDMDTCLTYTSKVLGVEPCREDAHRLAIRCYHQLGQRAQALRQFRLCERVLRMEFDAAPEPETIALFDRIRLDPGNV
jgi:DNA-binding SARP family transcriptional activator